MKSKTIILSSPDEKGRGILTLLEEEDFLSIRLRLYNTKKITKYCKIGIYHNEKAYSANLLEKNGSFTSSMVGDFNINKDFYSALIDTSNNNEVILSGGSYAGYFFNDSSVFKNDEEMLEGYEDVCSIENTQAKTHKEQINTNTNCEDCEKCKTCMYKEYFYSTKTENPTKLVNQESTTLKQEEAIDSKDQPKEKTILENLVPQFQYVFENYPKDETLSNLLPNSKFVTIQEKDSQYSIGALYEENEMKYICYARLCNYNTPAPQELGEHYQWLPIDKDDPLSEGYYIVFQDAKDLKIVEL